MLRLTVSPEEYLMIGENIKIVFLGGTKNYLRIMVDAPKDVNVVRSTVLEAKITDPEERAKLPKYYREPDYKPSKRMEEREAQRQSHGKGEQSFRKSKVIMAGNGVNGRQ